MPLPERSMRCRIDKRGCREHDERRYHDDRPAISSLIGAGHRQRLYLQNLGICAKAVDTKFHFSQPMSVRGGGKDRRVGAPIVVFVLCLCGGAIVGSRWLPDLDVGPVGGLAFFVVCGLLGLALALLGEHMYLLVTGLEQFRAQAGGVTKGELVAEVLRNTAFEDGTVLGLAVAVYLLAPRVARVYEPDEEPQPSA